MIELASRSTWKPTEHGGNWRLGAGHELEARPDTGTGDGWRLRGADHVRIEDAAISYRTPAFAAPRRLRIQRLDARVPGPEAPTTIDLRASYRERTLTAHVRLHPCQRLWAAGDGYRVHDLDLCYGDSNLPGRGRPGCTRARSVPASRRSSDRSCGTCVLSRRRAAPDRRRTQRTANPER